VTPAAARQKKMLRKLMHRLAALLAAVNVALAAPVGMAAPVDPSERIERKEPLPKRLEGIDVVEHLEARIPMDTRFLDEQGKSVRIGDYLTGKLPVIVTLNYSNCPMLCSLQLNGLVESLKQLDWSAGSEFEIVTVSIDPEEKPENARRTKARYLRQYGRPHAASGWHFLTGSEQSIQAVANAIGFRYGYNEKRKEYVHPAAIALLTPVGHIARYLYGIQYHPKTVRLSLVEVSQGKIGSTVDRLILYCFHYDATEGRYAPIAMNIMRVGATIGAILLGGFLLLLWKTDMKKKRALQGEALS
jgi:protein SCO1/2